MYVFLLWLHSDWRWVVVLTGVLAVVHAFWGLGSGRSWDGRARLFPRLFVGALDLQFLLGLSLYLFASPITKSAFANFGGVMREPLLRFFTVEHPFAMIAAVALAHVGSARAKRPGTDAQRYRRFAVWGSVALLLLLAGMPWPGLDVGRPLLRY